MKKTTITAAFIQQTCCSKILKIMRNTLLLLLLNVFHIFAVNSYSQTATLTLNLNDITVKEALTQIEEQSEFYFLYNSKLIDVNRKTTLQVKDQKIDRILSELFDNTDVNYIVFNRQIILSPKDYVINLKDGVKQPQIITGTVTDQKGYSMIGVTIMVKGTTQGTITDAQGMYSISNVPENGVLVFSFVGMRSQEVVVGNQTTINIMMEEALIRIDEVVAIGYGTQSRRYVSASVSNIQSELIEDRPVSNVLSAIQGKVAGVNIYSQNFNPGATPKIIIRGGSSIDYSNDPLIIVDGVPRSLSDLNPNDIESINVLKDAASTSIYGSRASNGVVLINTKAGKLRKAPEITFRSELSFQKHHKGYPLTSAEEMINLVRTNIVGTQYEQNIYRDGPASHVNGENSIYTTRWLNVGETIPPGWKSMDDPIFPGKTLIYQENDPNEILFDLGLWQNYHLGINGGSENIRYAASIGYTDDNGVVLETGYKRLTAASNIDIHITDKLIFNSIIDYTNTNSPTEPEWRQSVSRQRLMAPTIRLRYEDGSPVPGFNSGATWPYFWRETRDYHEYRNKIALNESLIFEPIEGLKLKGNYSYYRSDFENEYFEISNYFRKNRQAYVTQNLDEVMQFEGIASYTRTFIDKHDLSLMLGFSDLFMKNRNLYLNADGGSTDIIPTLNAAPNKNDASSFKTEESLIGIFGRVGYIYNKKYLFQGSLRRDGSSKFGRNNKWAYFPSFSAGWILSEEPFLKSINSISNLKLRTSYGVTGNNAIGIYTAQGEYQAVKYAGNMAIIPTVMANQNLAWERTKQFDLGFDLGFLNERFSLLFDYYTKITDNLLFNKPLPNTSGFSSITTNIGKVKFYGIDLDINANIIGNNNLRWDVWFIYNLNKNVVLELPDNDREKNRIGGYSTPTGDDFGGIAEGESLYSIIGYKVDYIIDNQDQADNALYDNLAQGISKDGTLTKIKGRKFPGDYEWVDRDGNGIINEYDQFVVGYSMPHTTGGFGNTLTWKRFMVDIFFDYAIGHSVMDDYWANLNMNGFNTRARPTKYMITDSWQKEGDAATAFLPAFYNQDPAHQKNLDRPNDRRCWKLDYLCLREIKLSYDVPVNWIRKVGLNKINIYVTGNTLLYFTKDIHAKEVNPEWGATSNQNDNTGYPPIRKFNFGFKAIL